MLKKYIYPIVLCSMFSASAFAETPSTASIQQLMQLLDAQTQYEQELEYSKQSYQEMMQQVLDSQAKHLDEDKQKKFQTFSAEMLDLMMQESQWTQVEPETIQIWQDIYTQEEINSMIQYYQTPMGQSILKKMPLATEKSNAIVQGKIDKFMPQFIEKLKNLTTPH